IVAEVLQSAEAMKAAVNYLEPFMEKSESNNRGKIVLATVKGDVHDIGKNLVEIILSNNGYRVINLGIRVPPEQLIKVYQQEKPDAIGLSGLLVKSAQQMVVTVQDFRSAGMEVPVLVGGAALTKKFTGTRIASEYPGPVIYAKDAMEGLGLVNQLINEDERETLLAKLRREQQTMQASTGISSKRTQEAAPRAGSGVRKDYPVPRPPDYELHIPRNVDLRQIFSYINPTMLYGKHLGLRGTFDQLLASGDEKAVKLKGQVEALQRQIVERSLMMADGIYRFYPCQSREGDLLIYDPEDPTRVIETFSFPRQPSGERLCLSDYCREVTSGEMDAIAMFVVTCGRGIRELSHLWKEAGEYLRSHMLQAIAIESAEAFAEWLHTKIRADWGFADPPDLSIKDVLKNKYRGIRVSFGYPACPDLADQRKLFKLLDPSQIGMDLTEGDMMDPEASVSALVFHHPEAKYFRTDIG
ncbi:MAG: vitamin B12 dependent-methionine synthase activation domain-containing protein, partial [Nitrospiria bacterium]